MRFPPKNEEIAPPPRRLAQVAERNQDICCWHAGFLKEICMFCDVVAASNAADFEFVFVFAPAPIGVQIDC